MRFSVRHSGKQGKCTTFAYLQAMQSGPNCKKLVEGSAPKPLKTRTMFCGCSIFLRQMRFRQWADMKETVMSDSCVLHAILAWRLSLFVKITTALALAGRGLGAEPTNKLLQKLLTLHCLPQPFSHLDSVIFSTDCKFVIRAIAALFCCC